jgi:hypothetical protein
VHVAERRGGASRACAQVAAHVEKQLGCPMARSSRSFATDDRLVRSCGEVLRTTRASRSRRSAAAMGDLRVVGASSWVTGGAMGAQSWVEQSSTAPCELDEGSSVVDSWALNGSLTALLKLCGVSMATDKGGGRRGGAPEGGKRTWKRFASGGGR